MAKRGGRGGHGGLRGRTRIAIGLAAFVLVASAVIWRRSLGLREAAEVRRLDVQRAALDGDVTKLETTIRSLTSREKLGAVAEQRLHMRVPDDSQVIVIPVPNAPH
jgi:cell division protein FtsL